MNAQLTLCRSGPDTAEKVAAYVALATTALAATGYEPAAMKVCVDRVAGLLAASAWVVVHDPLPYPVPGEPPVVSSSVPSGTATCACGIWCCSNFWSEVAALAFGRGEQRGSLCE